MPFTAAESIAAAAAFLNDTAQTIFTNALLLPYFNQAIRDLNMEMELNNVPVTNETSAVLPIVVGVTAIDFTTTPALPSDLVEIQMLSERLSGTTDDFVQMTKTEYLPQTQILTSSLIYWSWVGQVVQFIGATTNRDVKLNYISLVIPPVTNVTDSINVLNAMSYLSYRTGALGARYIGENPSRADELDGMALIERDRFLGINTKGRQSITTRRRPFRSSYKIRTGY